MKALNVEQMHAGAADDGVHEWFGVIIFFSSPTGESSRTGARFPNLQ